MSSIEEHTAKSFESIRQRHPELFEKDKENLEMLIPELHKWLDEYAGKKGDGYDYTGIDCIKHREQRHHVEGVREAVEIFTEKYGKEFTDIIDEEATRHVAIDMGCVPFKYKYSDSFWKSIRGF